MVQFQANGNHWMLMIIGQKKETKKVIKMIDFRTNKNMTFYSSIPQFLLRVQTTRIKFRVAENFF